MTLVPWRCAAISSVVLAGILIGWNCLAQTRGGPPPRPTTGSGPYKAVMEMDAGLPDHTVYRPEDLSALNGATLPLVDLGQRRMRERREFFQQLSYRYLFVWISRHTLWARLSNAIPVVPPRRQFRAQPAIQQPTDTTQLPRNLPPAATHPSQMIDAIKWATAENDRAGSKYYKHLNTAQNCRDGPVMRRRAGDRSGR